jgi:hypothetical protein
MTGSDPKADLRRYLQAAREALVWKLDGLSEHDARRPMVPTGTNLLGLVKHVASVEAGYFGETFGRPFPEPLPWLDEGAEPNADMWATAEESREQIVDCTTVSGRTRTPRSTRWRWMPSARCRGGRGSGARSRCNGSSCT